MSPSILVFHASSISSSPCSLNSLQFALTISHSCVVFLKKSSLPYCLITRNTFGSLYFFFRAISASIYCFCHWSISSRGLISASKRSFSNLYSSFNGKRPADALFALSAISGFASRALFFCIYYRGLIPAAYVRLFLDTLSAASSMVRSFTTTCAYFLSYDWSNISRLC